MNTKIDKLLNEMVGEITKQSTITVKDGNNDKRYFTFDASKLNNLDKELNKAYGSKIVKAIIKEIKKAIEGGYLKQFANDRSVDFIIKDGELKSVFKQKSASVETDEEDIVTEELSAEIVQSAGDKLKKLITITASDHGVIRKYIYSKGTLIDNSKNTVPPANQALYPDGSDFMKKVILRMQTLIDSGEFDGNDGKQDITIQFDKTGKILDMKPVIMKDPS